VSADQLSDIPVAITVVGGLCSIRRLELEDRKTVATAQAMGSWRCGDELLEQVREAGIVPAEDRYRFSVTRP
jgi:hypothetical protein